MHSTTLSAAALLLAGLQFANAQTFTSCNPLQKTCPSDPALGTTLTTDFTTGASPDWTLAEGTTLSYGANGAEFVINTPTEAPTISSNKYIFFGLVEAKIRSAPGTGIVSSFILESDDLDEIDWEWLGGQDTSVESNFFGKGNTTTYDRAIYNPVTDPVGTWHTYTVDWTSAYIKWSIDGAVVRTLNYGDALALGGKNFPQTPMKIKMGNWVGCADAAANEPSSPTFGTCQWAGGPASFTGTPAYTMYVQNVTIQDYSCGSSYTYGDMSGSYESIVVAGSCNGKTVSSSVLSSAQSSVTSSIASSSGGVFIQTSSSWSSLSSTTVTTSSSSSSAVSTTMSTATASASAAMSTVTSAGSSTTPSSTPSQASASPAIVSASSASTMTPKSKYGAIDFVVMALGLTLGYFVM